MKALNKSKYCFFNLLFISDEYASYNQTKCVILAKIRPNSIQACHNYLVRGHACICVKNQQNLTQRYRPHCCLLILSIFNDIGNKNIFGRISMFWYNPLSVYMTCTGHHVQVEWLKRRAQQLSNLPSPINNGQEMA